jgi:hypothetical protein
MTRPHYLDLKVGDFMTQVSRYSGAITLAKAN